MRSPQSAHTAMATSPKSAGDKGMTLQYIKIDCIFVNRSGMLGIALERARSSKCVELVHYSSRCAISSPKKYQSAQVVGDSQPDDLVECCPALHEAHQPLNIDCPIPHLILWKK